MKRKVLGSFVFGVFFVFALAATSFAQSYETTVKWGVNFRAAPGLDSYVFRMIPKGEAIHVMERYDDTWLKVLVQDGTIGFISAKPKYTNYFETTPIDKEIITTGYPWFRSEPHSNSTKYRSIPKGTILTALSSITNGYVKVEFDGREGWIHTNYAKYLNPAPAEPTWEEKADDIIDTAMSYIGRVTYKFGVRDYVNLWLDCSSFTELVYEQHGIDMKWGTRYQKNMGEYVSKSNLRKGDLVFFDTNGDGSINHVGIYIGDGKFIENGPSAGVRISDLNSSYWSQKYETGRRIIQ